MLDVSRTREKSMGLYKNRFSFALFFRGAKELESGEGAKRDGFYQSLLLVWCGFQLQIIIIQGENL